MSKEFFVLIGVTSDNLFLYIVGMSSESAPAAAQRNEDTSQLYTSQWQPLSMNALVEYKKQKQTNGDGKFRHGQHRMFAVKS